MAKVNAKQSLEHIDSRSKRHEALAARVRHRAEAAISALHDAAKDRLVLHQIEWNEVEIDSLAEIDEIGDALQGTAARVIGGSAPPNISSVLHTLEEDGHRISELRSSLSVYSKRLPSLWLYLRRLQELLRVLEAYFQQEAGARNLRFNTAPNPRQRIKKSA